MREHATTHPFPGSSGQRHYLPGMGRHALLPLYDPFTRLFGIRSAHQRLADGADLGEARRVLEIGCGTANLALLVKRTHPQLEVAGLDPDPKALSRASRKARRAGLQLQLDRGFADALPYPDGSFDRVLSSLMFHHLQAELRLATLQEVARVLRPGGSLHLLDFGGDASDVHGIARRLRHSHTLQDNWGARIPTLMQEAGLNGDLQLEPVTSRIGRLTCYRARSSGSAS